MTDYLGIDISDILKQKNIDSTDLIELEQAEKEIRFNILKKHVANGVIFKNLENVYIDDTVVIEKGVVIFADNHLRGSTKIGRDCVLESGNIITDSVIGSNVKISKSVLDSCKIGAFTTVGPNAHVHTNSVIDRECRIGNFVEIKNSSLGFNTKVAHLAYVGDCDIGNKCNVGCGSIFVNYDGKNKHRSYIGDSVFIGSNSNVIAPVRIEDNAYIAAGTTVTVDLPKDCMCIGRSRETVKENRSKYRKGDYQKKYFGTDGIRGVYGKFLTEEIAYLTGNFLGYSSDGGKIVVGRDNRLSGKPLRDALVNGITDAGATVIDLDVVSTPATAFVTTLTSSNYGIVLSASHNPPEYNGIKVFNFDGRKLTNIEEIEIEKHIENGRKIVAEQKGEILSGEGFYNEYAEALKRLIGDLSGLKVVLDCANGAVAKTAPMLFKSLGAEIWSFNVSEDGKLINDGCGALHPDFCSKMVLRHGADLGFSFDGDADRLIAIDHNGHIVDGDSIIYIIGNYYLGQGHLNKNTVVGTYHTNMGVEKSLEKRGITLFRTDIGDHFVMEKMLRDNLMVGGEQSGHIILNEFSNTGDGVLAGLFLSKLVKEGGVKLADLDTDTHYPQANVNIITDKKAEIMSDERVKAFVAECEKTLADNGRILFRASGTEPKVRIMVEAGEKATAENTAAEIENFIKKTYDL